MNLRAKILIHNTYDPPFEVIILSGQIPLRDQKILCTRSGNRCANPECRKILVINSTKSDRESLVAQMAHIKGEKPGAPRYDSSMSDKQRNSYENLILLCNVCHKMIDDQYNTFTVEKLYEMKQNHEKWVLESTEKEITNVTFAELEIVTKYLISNQVETTDSYTLIPPKEKIRKNELSSSTERLITRGLTEVKQVGQYIDGSTDMQFGDRLKQGFVTEYQRLRNEEKLSGDDLFNALLEFASGKSTDFKRRAAGLSVLVYLFEKCEVFEK